MTVIPEVLHKKAVDATFEQTSVPDIFHFLSTFGESNSPDELIEWLVFVGDHGMAPVVRRSAQSPIYAGEGIFKMATKGAAIKEKTFHSEEDVNKCLSSDPVRAKAAMKIILSKNEQLARRNMRRQDWLASQIFFNRGVVNYQDKEGSVWTLDYQVPDSHYKKLSGGTVWGDGADRNPLKDVTDAQQRIKVDSGGTVSAMFINSRTLADRLSGDEDIQKLLQANAFYQGQNLLTNPEGALSAYLKVMKIIKYDEFMPYSMKIINRVDASTYQVDDPWAVVPGSEVVFKSTDRTGQKLYKDELGVIASIDLTTSQIVLENPLTKIFNQRDDKIHASIPFLQDDRIILMAETIPDGAVCEWINSPMGIPTKYGLQSKTWEEPDPDGVFVRAQNLGLWALKSNQCFYTLDVA